MKKALLLVALVAMGLSSVAQNKAQQKRITEVRTLYARAMENIKADAELPETDNHLVIDLHRMMPGTGIQNKKVSCYSHEAGDEDQMYKWDMYFMRSSYNVAALQFNEEYLVDEKSQQPVFIFFVGNTYQHDGTIEKRYYFNADGTPCFLQITHKDDEGGVISKEEIKDYDDNIDALDMMRSFHDNMNMYNNVMSAGFYE
ncbi:hypothetical protein [Sodaliphilus sp.]|uniref:hypothetical protein n=1 Tax=Sodaliphilus sp. TaxID=2815818 RepID=UPI00388DACC2